MNGREYVIYLDVFFLLNFIMAYMIILLTARIIKNAANKKRYCLAAVIFALYSVLILKPLFIHLFNTTFLNIIVAAVISGIAFGFTDIKTYFRNILLLLTVTAGFLGVINFLYYSTTMGKYTRNLLCGTSDRMVNGRRFIIVSVLAYILLNLIMEIINYIRKDESTFFDVKLTHKGRSVMARALYDTGNSLVEPFSGEEVHIAEYKLLKIILEGDEHIKEKIYIIPFHSIGMENGTMYGIRIDEMVIIYQGKPIFIYNPIIGIYKGSISSSGKYSVILNGNIDSKIKESRGD